MKRDRCDRTFKLLLTTGILLAASACFAVKPVCAQGIAEYGGVMGMSKPVPSGHAAAVQNLYRVPNLGGAALGASGGSSGGVTAGAGSPYVGDSRIIAKNVADKANAFYSEAQKKEKAGKLAEAEALYRNSVIWRERVWGTKDPAVFQIYGKIGSLCVKQNKMEDAETAFRRQIACAVRLYGAGAYEISPVLSNLAEALAAEKKWSEAAATYKQVFQLKKRKLGDSSSETLSAMLKLAVALKQSGNVKDGDAMAKEGAALAQQSPENALLVESFNEVINPSPANAAPPQESSASPGSSDAGTPAAPTSQNAKPEGDKPAK